MTEADRLEQERLEELLDTFMTPGWKHLVEEFQEIATQIDTVYGVNDIEALCRVKGKLDTISVFLSYEETVRRALDETDI